MNLTKMNPLQRAIGVVLIVVGVVWVLQGIGVATGSVMTGNTIWAVLGAAAFVAGVLVLRRQPRPAPEHDPAPDVPEAPASPEPGPSAAQEPQPPAVD